MAIFTTLFAASVISGTAAAIGAAVVYGGIAVDQTIKANKSAKQSVQIQQQAAAVQIKQQKIQATQARRSAVRSSIIARGSATQRAAVTGTIGGSGFLGGQSSLMSQLGANLGFGSMMSGLSADYTQLSSDAAAASGQAQIASSRAALGFQAATFAAGKI